MACPCNPFEQASRQSKRRPVGNQNQASPGPNQLHQTSQGLYVCVCVEYIYISVSLSIPAHHLTSLKYVSIVNLLSVAVGVVGTDFEEVYCFY